MARVVINMLFKFLVMHAFKDQLSPPTPGASGCRASYTASCVSFEIASATADPIASRAASENLGGVKRRKFQRRIVV